MLKQSYAIERELGGGGMSRVFVARDLRLGRRVVIKLLPPEQSLTLSVERFRREIQIAAQLRHPHIVPLLEAGEVADTLLHDAIHRRRIDARPPSTRTHHSAARIGSAVR
jgi:serine/threonine-protein kinase